MESFLIVYRKFEAEHSDDMGLPYEVCLFPSLGQVSYEFEAVLSFFHNILIERVQIDELFRQS